MALWRPDVPGVRQPVRASALAGLCDPPGVGCLSGADRLWSVDSHPDRGCSDHRVGRDLLSDTSHYRLRPRAVLVGDRSCRSSDRWLARLDGSDRPGLDRALGWVSRLGGKKPRSRVPGQTVGSRTRQAGQGNGCFSTRTPGCSPGKSAIDPPRCARYENGQRPQDR